MFQHTMKTTKILMDFIVRKRLVFLPATFLLFKKNFMYPKNSFDQLYENFCILSYDVKTRF